MVPPVKSTPMLKGRLFGSESNARHAIEPRLINNTAHERAMQIHFLLRKSYFVSLKISIIFYLHPSSHSVSIFLPGASFSNAHCLGPLSAAVQRPDEHRARHIDGGEEVRDQPDDERDCEAANRPGAEDV